jgi:PKD repeat protein
VPTNGLWTARFQVTPTQWGESSASGSFTGLGVLGSGTYWNSVSAYGWGGSGTFSSATSYQDNGSTNSGITCTLTGGSNVSSGPYATNDVRGLLSQVIGVFGTGYTTNSIALAKMPNGYYNMAIHGACAGWNDRGATFRVHGMNGDQIAGTTNTPQVTLFENYVTTVLFTNVEVTNGILNVDVEPTPIVPSHNPNTEGYYNGVEVQLVSYGPPTAGFSAAATNVAVGQWFEFYDQSSTVTNVVWDFGDGNVDSTVNGNVYHGYSTAGTYTVSQTVTGPGGTASVTNVNYIVVTNVAPVLSTNAFLASLAVNPPAGTLPGFATNVYSYSVTNAYVNNPVQVTASSADTNATMTLTFNTVSAGSLTNGVAGGNQTLVLPTNTVVVQVVSQDLSQTNTYTVNVLLQPSQTVPKLTNSVSGNNLVLSWPADHLGYRLLVQTNNLNKGVSANISDWGTVAGSTTNTSMSIQIIKATNNAYYRLVNP